MPSLGGRVPQVIRCYHRTRARWVSMPSLGGRVPQAAHVENVDEAAHVFQCPLWADGSRRTASSVTGMPTSGKFQCPLWADGSRRPVGQPRVDPLAVRFNALFGRTGPAGYRDGNAFDGTRAVSMPSLGGRVPQDVWQRRTPAAGQFQ